MEIQTSTNMLWSAVKVSAKIKSRRYVLTAIQFQWRQGIMKVMLDWVGPLKCTLMEIGILQCRSESESEVVQQIQCHMKSDSTGTDGAIQSNAQKLSPLLVVVGGGVSKLKISYFLTLQMQIWFILALSSWEKELTDNPLRRTPILILIVLTWPRNSYFHTAHKLHSLCYRKQDDES